VNILLLLIVLASLLLFVVDRVAGSEEAMKRRYVPINPGRDIATTMKVNDWLTVEIDYVGYIVGMFVGDGHNDAEAYVTIVGDVRIQLPREWVHEED
jgi:hypothetical protein